jgi:hypothetical protein
VSDSLQRDPRSSAHGWQRPGTLPPSCISQSKRAQNLHKHMRLVLAVNNRRKKKSLTFERVAFLARGRLREMPNRDLLDPVARCEPDVSLALKVQVELLPKLEVERRVLLNPVQPTLARLLERGIHVAIPKEKRRQPTVAPLGARLGPHEREPRDSPRHPLNIVQEVMARGKAGRVRVVRDPEAQLATQRL